MDRWDMPTNNIIANLFTTLFNTEDRRKNNCVVVPTSKLGMEVLKTLKNEGYIGDFESKIRVAIVHFYKAQGYTDKEIDKILYDDDTTPIW